MKREGFTLMELLIVVILLGVLAGIAVPTMQKATEQGFKREALDVLLTIYSAERAYLVKEDAYHGPLDPCGGGLICMAEWRTIGMDDPNALQASPVTFSVDVVNVPPPPTFSATADRGSGKTLTIDENRVITDAWSIP